MDNITDTSVSKGKIYKDKAFWAGTYLGGPLVAGYLFAENFKVLGQPENVKPTWVISIIFTIIIFGGIFMIPEDIDIPNFIIPLIYTAVAYGLFKKYQAEKAEQHMQQGGEVYGWGRLILVGIIGLVLTVGPIFSLAYLADTLDQANLSTKTYGENVIDYDNTTVSEKEVDNIAKGFTETGFFERSFPKYVYVEKEDNTYEFSFSVVKAVENDMQAQQAYKSLRDQMDVHLPNHKVEFKLVVDYLDNVVKIIR